MMLQINFRELSDDFDRDVIEEALNTALEQEGLGQANGCGGSVDGSSCDISVEVADIERGLQVVRQVLIPMRIAPSTTIDEVNDNYTIRAVHPVFTDGCSPGMNPPQGKGPPPTTLRLVRREPAGHVTPAEPSMRSSPDAVAMLRAEYKQIKANRARWRVLSLLFGGTGILLILLVDPKKAPSFLIIAALVMFGLGLMFSGKFKGRSIWWGFTALGRIRLIRRVAEPDLLKARLEELKRKLEAHGEKV
jgi:hypothetical protein